jgi:hypothetical protein
MSQPIIDSEQKFLIGTGLGLLSAVLTWVTMIPSLGPVNTIISGLCFLAVDVILMAVLVKHEIQIRNNDELYYVT